MQFTFTKININQRTRKCELNTNVKDDVIDK